MDGKTEPLVQLQRALAESGLGDREIAERAAALGLRLSDRTVFSLRRAQPEDPRLPTYRTIRTVWLVLFFEELEPGAAA